MAKRRGNETIRCRSCGEYYSTTYKRCPFCDETGGESYSDEAPDPIRSFAGETEDEPQPVPGRRERPAEPAEREEAVLYDTLPDEDVSDEPAPRRRSGSRGGKRLATGARPARPVRSAPVDEDEPCEEPAPRRARDEEPPPARYSSRRKVEYDDDEDDYDDDYDERYDRRRVSPLSIVGWVICLALVVAAAIIIFSFVKPHLTGDGKPAPTPGSSMTPGPVGTPAPMAPEAQFTLSLDELTLSGGQSYQLKVSFNSADAVSDIIWSSSDETIATVDGYGTVVPAGTGDAAITATAADGSNLTCVVHCTVGGSTVPTPPPSQSSAPSGNLKLNYTDISFSTTYPTPVRLKVSGTVNDPVWSIGDTAVATIAADGTVTPVASGMTTATATVDGQALECIIRVKF